MSRCLSVFGKLIKRIMYPLFFEFFNYWKTMTTFKSFLHFHVYWDTLYKLNIGNFIKLLLTFDLQYLLFILENKKDRRNCFSKYWSEFPAYWYRSYNNHLLLQQFPKNKKDAAFNLIRQNAKDILTKTQGIFSLKRKGYFH